ncbi:MAG: hypothetical protein ABII82_05450, partial [Verrucomicrobiota bacterium]
RLRALVDPLPVSREGDPLTLGMVVDYIYPSGFRAKATIEKLSVEVSDARTIQIRGDAGVFWTRSENISTRDCEVEESEDNPKPASEPTPEEPSVGQWKVPLDYIGLDTRLTELENTVARAIQGGEKIKATSEADRQAVQRRLDSLESSLESAVEKLRRTVGVIR